MKKILKSYFVIISFYNKFYNFLVLKFFAVSHQKYIINGKIFIRNQGKLSLGNNVLINSAYKYNPIGGQTFTSIVIEENAELIIGDGTGISNSAIYCAQKIVIGNNVFIGGDCKIYDTDFHPIIAKERIINTIHKIKKSEVHIQDNAFIGTGSIILKGITIGKNSVIAAGSVVSKNIPENQIWGGNPIQFIKNLPEN